MSTVSCSPTLIARSSGDTTVMIGSAAEYELTLSKLAHVRETIDRIEKRPGSNSALRSASLRSLRAYGNQLVEELIRYEIAHGVEPRTQQREALSGMR